MHNYRGIYNITANQRDGSFGLWFVSDALIHCCLRQNRPKEPSLWFVVCF